MFKALGVTLVCIACSTPAMANERQRQLLRASVPMPESFDLAAIPEPGSVAREDAFPVDSVLPRDLNERPFQPPAMQMELIDAGPVLSVGAMGAKFKDAPRLAHIAIGMDF
ncbi:hypothetical protein [Qipengyuania qiaonensis]|uniref:Uncharacterized protein n=1 Tax=Qipengyuania qiaonensis TaxID=2867240 RepID=A0ABS7J276_9SPHN|nr:hypothetical protein [Qipengyuania qiaonensis]MBX7481436.1 hypothetical protein [Qipengyuania qiaonensis]